MIDFALHYGFQPKACRPKPDFIYRPGKRGTDIRPDFPQGRMGTGD